MVLQHARAINRIDVLVWHNVSNHITNNPPQVQGRGRGRGRGRERGRGRGRGGGRGRGSRGMNLDPSSSTQLTPSTGDGPSAAPSTNAQPPPPTSVGPSSIPFSFAQPTPSTTACPSDDVTSSTHKRHRVAPSSSLPTSPDSTFLTTTHLPPSPRCHLESTPATPIRPSSSTLPTSPDSAPAAPIHHMASFLPHSVTPTTQSGVDMFYMQAVGLDHSTTHVESDSSACIFISTPSLHTPHAGVASTDPTLTHSPPASSLPTIVDCHHSLAEVPQPDVPQEQQLEERPRRNPVRNTKCWQCGTE
jgi:hypothetical protein